MNPTVVIVASDANPIINLTHVKRLSMLGGLPPYRFVVPDDVAAEITDANQRAQLDMAFDSGVLSPCALTDPDGLAMFAELRRILGAGESACLVLAERNGWHVASDERRAFRRVIGERIGLDRLLTTRDIYVLAIRAGHLTVAEADNDRAVLATRRFVMRGFMSFAELVRQEGDV